MNSHETRSRHPVGQITGKVQRILPQPFVHRQRGCPFPRRGDRSSGHGKHFALPHLQQLFDSVCQQMRLLLAGRHHIITFGRKENDPTGPHPHALPSVQGYLDLSGEHQQHHRETSSPHPHLPGKQPNIFGYRFSTVILRISGPAPEEQGFPARANFIHTQSI